MVGRLTIAALLAIAASPAAIGPPGLPQVAAAPTQSIVADPLGGVRPAVALLVDSTSGQRLYEHRADARFLPASMTKTMTLFVAFELMSAGKLSAEQRFTVTPATWQAWNGKGSGMFFHAGESVAVDTLLRAIATASANDAAVTLAEGHAGSVSRWTGLMNAQARALGMAECHFATPNGWPDGGATYCSASDLVRLGDALVARHPALYRRYFGQPAFTWNGAVAQNRDPVVGVVAGADGIKTGHTREAGYNFLGSADRGGRRLFLVVGGAASEAERATASRTLLEWGFSAWHHRHLFGPATAVGSARVQGGDARRVSLVARRAVGMSWPASMAPDARLSIAYNGPLIAPLRKGQPVAELRIVVAGAPAGRVLLFAAEDVGVASPLDRLVNGLAGLLPG